MFRTRRPAAGFGPGHRQPLLGHAVDLTLDCKDLADPADRFDSKRRFAKIGQYEELPVAAASRLGDRVVSAPGIVEIAKPGISIRLRASG